MTSFSSMQNLPADYELRTQNGREVRGATASAGWHVTIHSTGTDVVQVVDIDHSPFRIGRREGLSLTLASPAVSGEHAELLIDQAELLIRDLNSTNGTLKNGEPLTQPSVLRDADLLDLADVRLQVHRTSASQVETGMLSNTDPALSEFGRFLQMRSVTPYFQPVVWLADGSIAGCEVFSRGRVEGLETPQEMFRAAAQLKLEAELSRNLRLIGCENVTMLAQTPRLFLNTHAEELYTIGLLDSLRRVRQLNPGLPITVELAEPNAQLTDIVQQFHETLASLNMGLAYDHFGSGHTLRAHLALVQPEYVKFDMHLIRDIHLATKAQQSLLADLVQMVHDQGAVSVAIGVETEFEHIACREVGFKMGQGFFYGRPAAHVPTQLVPMTT